VGRNGEKGINTLNHIKT